MIPSPVVVLGMHRSGTSLCANLLHRLGIEMAEAPGASPANQRGHWERPRINDLNDRVLALFGRGWDETAHILALPEGWMDDARVREVQAELAAWLAPRLRAGRPFGLKDPRTARLMPMWRALFRDLGAMPRFVYCVRDPAQVARSVAARDRMAREQAEYRWAIYNADAIGGVGNDTVCIVPYEAWFAAPEETAARLAEFAGVCDRAPARLAAIVNDTVSAELRHDGGAPVPRAASRRLHRGILRCVTAGQFDPDLRAFAAALSEFTQLVQPMLVGTEILRTSLTHQNRVIADLNALVTTLRQEAA